VVNSCNLCTTFLECCVSMQCSQKLITLVTSSSLHDVDTLRGFYHNFSSERIVFNSLEDSPEEEKNKISKSCLLESKKIGNGYYTKQMSENISKELNMEGN